MLRTIRVASKSRGIFKNWFSAGVRYFLWRHSLVRTDQIRVVCWDGDSANMSISVFGDVLNAYFDGDIIGYSCSDNAVITKDGVKIPTEELLMSNVWREALRLGWNYDSNNGYWVKDGVKFRHMHWPILETFDYGQYGDVDVNGKVVLDIGAFVGDTPIYFALRGAKLVYAIEPLPANYLEMLDNVKLNGLDSLIIPINIAIDYERRFIEIPRSTEPELRGSSVARMRSSKGEVVRVEARALRELLSQLPQRPSILKMDCEGCEFDVILNDYESVRSFDVVVFEYHAYEVNKPLTLLISRMVDFECHLINEQFYSKFFPKFNQNKLGMIRCTKHEST